MFDVHKFVLLKLPSFIKSPPYNQQHCGLLETEDSCKTADFGFQVTDIDGCLVWKYCWNFFVSSS